MSKHGRGEGTRGGPPLEWLSSLNQEWHRLASTPRFNRLAPAVLLLVALSLPSVLVGNYWVRILGQAGLYIMMAMGLNVIVGYAGLLNLGYAAFFAIGAYSWALLASPHHDVHLPFLLVFPLAGLAAGTIAYLIAVPALKLRGDYLALVTVGFAESFRILVNNAKFTNAAAGIISIDHPRIGPIVLTSVQHYYYLLLALCAVEFFLMRRLEQSRIGMAWMAIREDDLVAETMGLDTRRLKLLAVFIGAIPAGLAGVLFAGMQTFVSPDSFRFLESIAMLSMVVVGGRGNAIGVALGAFFLTVVPEPLRGSVFDSARILIYGLLLVVMAIVRPQGLWPRRYAGVSKHGQIEQDVCSVGEPS